MDQTETENESKPQADFSALLEAFKRDCEQDVPENSSSLNDSLDKLFSSTPLSEISQVAQSFLAANSDSFEQYLDSVKRLCGRTICGALEITFYRCITCQKHGSMCLCESCFEAGPHRQLQHEFYSYKSDGLGTCDCGDDAFMQLEGACHNHGANGALVTQGNREQLDVLLRSARRIVPRLLTRITAHCRGQVNAQELSPLSAFFVSLSSCGEVFVDIIVGNLRDNALYLNTVRQIDPDGQVAYKNEAVQLELQSLVTRQVLEQVPERYRMYFAINHSCLLDELVFWLIRLSFPRSLTLLMLANLTSLDFRLACGRSLVRQYSLFCFTCNVTQPGNVTLDRVESTDFTSHFFNNLNAAVQLCVEEGLFSRILVTLSLMFSLEGALEQCKLAPDTSADSNFKVVVPLHTIIKSESYSGMLNDLYSLLRHRNIVQYLFENGDLFTQFLNNISMWQGSLVLERSEERSTEEGVSMHFFNGELQACYKPLFLVTTALLQRQDEGTRKRTFHHTMAILKAVSRSLQDWLACTGLVCDEAPVFGSTLTDQTKLSFHLPLHRYYAALLAVTMRLALPQDRHLVKNESESETEAQVRQFLESEASSAQCYCIVQHVLDVLSGQFQIACSAWSANRDTVNHLEVYRKPRSAFMYVDLDLLLTQFCASQLDGDLFLKLVIDKFYVSSVASCFPCRRSLSSKLVSADQAKLMQESLMLLLVWVSTCPMSWLAESDDMSERDRVARQQLVTYLGCEDLTQAAVLEHLPPDEFTATYKLKSTVLTQLPDIATRASDDPSARFVLKPEVWLREYNPAYTFLRFGRGNYKNAWKRYYQRTGLSESLPAGLQWPPLRVPSSEEFHRFLPFVKHWRFINSSTFYSLIFVTLDHAINYSKAVTDCSVHFALNLLGIALAYREYSTGELAQLQADYEPTSADVVQDLQLQDWYPASIVHDPLKCVVHRIGTVRTELGAFKATNRVNRSLVQLLQELYKVLASKRYVPPRVDSQRTPNETPFAMGTNLVSLLGALCERSELIANSLRKPTKPAA